MKLPWGISLLRGVCLGGTACLFWKNLFLALSGLAWECDLRKRRHASVCLVRARKQHRESGSTSRDQGSPEGSASTATAGSIPSAWFLWVPAHPPMSRREGCKSRRGSGCLPKLSITAWQWAGHSQLCYSLGLAEEQRFLRQTRAGSSSSLASPSDSRTCLQTERVSKNMPVLTESSR